MPRAIINTDTTPNVHLVNNPVTPWRRISNIDIVRGIIMLLMAVDHVRVYSGVPAGGPTPGVFFTRWITHFVAPAFCFLAGTGIWLYARKFHTKAPVARFLVTRGLWLIFLELTVLRLAWTFNVDFRHYMLAGVIWMLGWCMVLLSALVFLPPAFVGIFGLVVICTHNILDLFASQIYAALEPSSWAWIAQVVYYGGTVHVGHNGPPLQILYSIVPWIGVMAAGYWYGTLTSAEPSKQRRWNLLLGAVCIAFFIVLRSVDVYGDPRPWNPHPEPQAHAQNVSAPTAPQRTVHPRPPAVIRFLNTNKYPASLDFLLMTLGPMLLGLGIFQTSHNALTRLLETYGRVPMFYYMLHIPLIHALALAVCAVRTPTAMWWLFGNHPMSPPPLPDGYMWSLALLYAVWLVAVAILYLPCRWYARVKGSRKYPILSYL